MPLYPDELVDGERLMRLSKIDLEDVLFTALLKAFEDASRLFVIPTSGEWGASSAPSEVHKAAT